MAKRGRHSIRNKRKSIKKHSHKRRSKTRRYLRGGFREGKYTKGNEPLTYGPDIQPFYTTRDEEEQSYEQQIREEEERYEQQRREKEQRYKEQIRKEEQRYEKQRREEEQRYEQQIREGEIKIRQAKFDNCMKQCIPITDDVKRDRCMKKCSALVNSYSDNSDEIWTIDIGGRRRYYKRKSIKKHSHKRRSKSKRSLRGGMERPHTEYQGLSEIDEYNLAKESREAARKKADDELYELQLAHRKKMAKMTPEQQKEFYDSEDEED